MVTSTTHSSPAFLSSGLDARRRRDVRRRLVGSCECGMPPVAAGPFPVVLGSTQNLCRLLVEHTRFLTVGREILGFAANIG